MRGCMFRVRTTVIREELSGFHTVASHRCARQRVVEKERKDSVIRKYRSMAKFEGPKILVSFYEL